jgi:integrase
MRKTSGYVYEEGGKWYARMTFTDESGRRRNVKRAAESKADANKKLKSLVRQFDDEGEKGIEACSMTFNDLADYYEANYLKPARYIDDRKVEGLRDVSHLKACVRMFRQSFGRKPIRSITHGDLARFRTLRLNTQTQRKAQRSITTVNRELSALRRILNIAVRQGWLARNPFNSGDSLIDVSAERRRERILTLEEEAKLLAACEHPKRRHLIPLIIALLDTGARKGEMLKLVWRDVDFEHRLITFRALNTKTLQTRKVAMTERLHREFTRMWEQSSKDADARIYKIVNDVRKTFGAACEEAGIEVGGLNGISLHSLRHSAAVRLVKGRLPIEMVGRILGHTSPATTYRYISTDNKTLFQAAAILESIHPGDSERSEM